MDFLGVLDKYGLPLAFLCALFFGLYRGSRWLGSEVLKPVGQRYLAYISHMETMEEENAKLLQKMVEFQNEKIRMIEATTAAVREAHQTVKELENIVQRYFLECMKQMNVMHEDLLVRFPKNVLGLIQEVLPHPPPTETADELSEKP
jgi:hypothetical protein